MKMGLDNKKPLDKIQLAVQQELQIALDNAIKTIQSKIKLNINKEDTASYTTSCTASLRAKPRNIKDLVSRTSKNFNINYRKSIDSRKQDEEKHRLDRVMRTIKPWYSEDGYMDIIRGLQQASHFEKLDFIRNMEKAIVERRKAT